MINEDKQISLVFFGMSYNYKTNKLKLSISLKVSNINYFDRNKVYYPSTF
jgi:hypothetical protein